MAEQDRLEALHPPDVTPQIFERFLPYAIALDCENQWSRRFAAAAAAAVASGAASDGYSPVWYSGGGGRGFDPADFAQTLGTSMADAAAQASASHDGASGSGGGGGGW